MQQTDDTIAHTVTTIEGQRAVWLGGPACQRFEVVGETYNATQVARVVSAVGGRTDTVVVAWLVAEPNNQSDPHAVMVWVFGGRVGYLSRELAVPWSGILARLRARHGAAVACQAMVDPPSAANQGGFGIAVWLPPLPVQPPTSPQNPFLPGAPPSSTGMSVPTTARPTKPRPDPEPAPVPEPAPLSSQKLAELREELSKTTAELKRAKKELESVEEAVEIQSFGFYKPRYGFESSAQYTTRLDGIRRDQQALIKSGDAAPCDTKWTVGGSVAEGKKMVKQQAKLMLRAFNGECDAAIAKVRYDNVTKLEQRMTKAYDDINKLGQVQQVFISRRYFDLKLAELHLVHEHREKVQEEKEVQKRIRDQMREEQKAQEEIDRAKAEAENDEARSTAALEKARAELATSVATSKQHERLEGLVDRLETELKDALDRKAKAIARAQLTRSGHVYVLSNVGSFGEGIYKIGLTRRLDPYERVEELGDASVPFPFDVHAIIYAEDAPTLESKLHKAFASRRVNVVNHRKEYFRVTLTEIQQAVEDFHGLITFVVTPEAEEYNKTLAALAEPGAAPGDRAVARATQERSVRADS
ncbi:MAG: DUF4041 domain-containing protein [Labilithrix sp.]|nr:DUF4041 domain-containing protein [Labilithrix sp.]